MISCLFFSIFCNQLMFIFILSIQYLSNLSSRVLNSNFLIFLDFCIKLNRLITILISFYMSRVITNTNIIVDDFNFCKSFPKGTFIHFLTHFHSDHYQGLSPLWDYGHIYCSHMTKTFIMDKFPKLKNVYSFDLYDRNTLQIKPGLIIDFWLFDAKHIPGASMILFKGFMGTILFTGDFRYNFDMVKQNNILFPPQRRNGINKKDIVQKMSGISLHIDEMIFDNTYCNNNFKFGLEKDIEKMMIQIIQKNINKKLIYIAMGALGKHKILMGISRHFQTNIVVSEKQLMKIKVAGLQTDFLTTNPHQGFIQLISKKNRARIVQQTKKTPLGNNFICIDTDFLMLEHQAPDKINYIVPYSLHSNYTQMQTFIRMIKPCILRKLVIPFTNFRKVKLRIKIDHRLKFSKYLDFLQGSVHKSQSGYAHLVRHYTQVYNLSPQFLRWFEVKEQNKLKQILQVGDQDHSLRKRPVNLQQDQNSKTKPKKQNLKSIADNLKASHKNISIQDSFSFASQPNFSLSYSQIFQQEKQPQTESISVPFYTLSQGCKAFNQSRLDKSF